MHFPTRFPGSSHGYSGLSFRMCWQSRIFRCTENRLLTAMMKLTAKSGSFGAPTMGKRPKRSAAVKRRRWRPWFWVLPRKRMLHPSLKQSSVRCAKQQSWSEFTGSKTPRLRVTASASFSMSGRCHPERRSRYFSPTGIRMAAERPFSGRMLPSNRRRRKRISAASDKSFAH